MQQEVVVSYLPLSHIAAQIYDLWTGMQWGAQVCFAEPDALKVSPLVCPPVACPGLCSSSVCHIRLVSQCGYDCLWFLPCALYRRKDPFSLPALTARVCTALVSCTRVCVFHTYPILHMCKHTPGRHSYPRYLFLYVCM